MTLLNNIKKIGDKKAVLITASSLFALSSVGLLASLTSSYEYYPLTKEFKNQEQLLAYIKNDVNYDLLEVTKDLYSIENDGMTVDFSTESEAQRYARSQIELWTPNGLTEGYSVDQANQNGIANNSFITTADALDVFRLINNTSSTDRQVAIDSFIKDTTLWVNGLTIEGNGATFHASQNAAVADFKTKYLADKPIQTYNFYKTTHKGFADTKYTSTSALETAWKAWYYQQSLPTQVSKITRYTHDKNTDWVADALGTSNFNTTRDAWIAANSSPAGPLNATYGVITASTFITNAKAELDLVTCLNNAPDYTSSDYQSYGSDAQTNSTFNFTSIDAIDCNSVVNGGVPLNVSAIKGQWDTEGTKISDSLFVAAVTKNQADYLASSVSTTDFNAWVALPAQRERWIYDGGTNIKTHDQHLNTSAIPATNTIVNNEYALASIVNVKFFGWVSTDEYTTRAAAETYVESLANEVSKTVYYRDTTTNYYTSKNSVEQIVIANDLESKKVNKNLGYLTDFDAQDDFKNSVFKYNFDSENKLFDTKENLFKYLYLNIGESGITHNTNAVREQYVLNISKDKNIGFSTIVDAKSYWISILT